MTIVLGCYAWARRILGMDYIDMNVRFRHYRQPPFEELATQSNLALPHSFRRFMISQDLQSRVCSCTDCYLDPGQRIVETTGSLQGHLIHFLSDSQS